MPLRAVRAPRPLQLLELDVRWPPETFLRWKFEGLAERGVDVTVASRAIADPSARLRGVKLLPLPARASADRAAAAVRRAVARLRPDVVHIEWHGSAVRFSPQFSAWRCPVVLSAHGSQLSADRFLPGHEHYAARLPVVLRAARAVHCVSESLAREVIALGVDSGQARVIRQGVDPALFRPAGPGAARARNEPLRVISIGWPRWLKGFEWALQAARVAIDSGVPIQLAVIGARAGEPTELARLSHTVADLRLGGQVRLEPAASSAEVAERLRGSDVLLLPSLCEGLPTVVLEAMACGVAVVASDCGGVREAVCDGVQGLLVAPRDAVGLAGALERLWRDPGLRARMGVEGRRTVVSGFTLDRQLDQFVALYEEVGGG
jgi:colanic acid/amylovoran biosynthesis glycosyltransferase